MNAYANLSLIFEQMRLRAWLAARSQTADIKIINSSNNAAAAGVPDAPPRILVIGPESSGKTTACKLLANYAVRTDAKWSPMLINLDTSEVSLIPPSGHKYPVNTVAGSFRVVGQSQGQSPHVLLIHPYQLSRLQIDWVQQLLLHRQRFPHQRSCL